MLHATFYDPSEHAENVVFKRNLSSRRVYSLGHDPKILSLKLEIDRVGKAKDYGAIEPLASKIDKAIESSKDFFHANYIPLLISLSAHARIAGRDALAAKLYKTAHNISRNVRDVSKRDYERYYAYHGFNQAQKRFDLEARYRRYLATWERTSLEYLASSASISPPEDAVGYIQDILRIIDNESIFDIIDSNDYADAAVVLDSTKKYPSIVYDLFLHAIRSRRREQFEASYDLDMCLAEKIDKAGLSLDDRDELLRRLAEVSIQRSFSSAVGPMIKARARDEFIDVVDRAFEPFNGVLELAERRGYVKTENVLWSSLRKACESVRDNLTNYDYADVISAASRIAILRHPELVNPESRDFVVGELTFENDYRRGEAEQLFKSAFERAEDFKYPHLPSVWTIRKDGIDALVLEVLLSEVPTDGSEVDPYLLDLLRAGFKEEFASKIGYDEEGDAYIDPQSSGVQAFSSSGHIVDAMISHFGARDFKGLAIKRPDVVGTAFLDHIGKGVATIVGGGLMSLSMDPSIPLTVRAKAFRSLSDTKLISPYLKAKFESAEYSDEALRTFMSHLKDIWLFDTDEPVGDQLSAEYRIVHLPDWLISPLFEDLLATDFEIASRAMGREIYEDRDDGDTERLRMDVTDLTHYDVLKSEMANPDNALFRIKDESYIPVVLRRLCYETAHYLMGIENPMYGDGSTVRNVISPEFERADEIEPMNNYWEIDPDEDEEEWVYNKAKPEDAAAFAEGAINAYRRNNIIVRANSIKIPAALMKVNPKLRFVISNYIANVPSTLRHFILTSMYEVEADAGEDKVLKIFFELTGLEKLAQFLSIQEDVVPESYQKTLAGFQEEIKPSSKQEILDTLMMYGISPDSFGGAKGLEFMHAGTVGEVWTGVDDEGHKLAIKLLPYKKMRKNRESLLALKLLSDDMQLFRHKLFGGMDFVTFYERYRQTLLEEMDYGSEFKNARTLEKGMSNHGIAFPKMWGDYLRPEVLVMDYENFQNISDLSEGDGGVLVEKTGGWLADSIFNEGRYYEDFHPGNVKWLPAASGKDGRPLMLDFGRIGKFEESQVESLVDFVVGLTANINDEMTALMSAMLDDDHPMQTTLTGDADARLDYLTDAMTGMIAEREHFNKAVFKREIGEYVDKTRSSGNGEKASHVMETLFGVVAGAGEKLDPSYMQFIKAVNSWENVMKRVDPGADFSTHAAPVILEKLQRRGGGGSTPSPSDGGDNSPAGGTSRTSGGAGSDLSLASYAGSVGWESHTTSTTGYVGWGDATSTVPVRASYQYVRAAHPEVSTLSVSAGRYVGAGTNYTSTAMQLGTTSLMASSAGLMNAARMQPAMSAMRSTYMH